MINAGPSGSAPGSGLLTLDEVKQHLNIEADDTSNDVELAKFIPAAFDVIGSITGPLAPVTVTETVRSDGSEFLLSYFPVIGVTGVTRNEWGSQVLVAPGGYSVDSHLGSVTLPRNFDYLVTYTYGMSGLPPAVRMATLELIRHWWQQSQQGLRAVFDTDESGPTVSMGFAIPTRVREYLSGHEKLPGIL